MIIKNITPSINASVDSSTTNISIHFNLNVGLSIGNITIYKASDNSIRQSVSATSEFCKLTANERIINISVINSTFNEYGEKYYVKMDNNFAKTKFFNEPLRGIENRVWFLKSDSSVKHSDEDVTGLIQLTQNATKKFSNFSESERLNYFDALKQELINKVPVKKSNLILGPKFELANERIIIQLRIDRNVISDLDTMIKYKSITTFSSGVTNDLDQDFAIKDLTGGPWYSYGTQIVAVIVTYIILYLLSCILDHQLKSNKFEAISSAILRLGLIIPNFILSILFVVHNSDDIPGLHLPSVILFSVSLLINFCTAIYTFYNGSIKYPVFKEWIIRNQGLVAILTILVTTDYEYLTIFKDVPRFNKVEIDYKYFTIMKDVPGSRLYPSISFYYEYLTILEGAPRPDEIPDKIKQINIFRQIFRSAIICGAFFDFFFKNIPQIIIQVIYYNSIVIYGLVPFLLLVTACLKIFIIIIRFVHKRALLRIYERNLKNHFYGKCEECKQYNTSPVWCKRCDREKETLNWKSENEDIDGAIKNFQRKAEKYDEVIEWIPYKDLTEIKEIGWVPIDGNNLQEIEEKLDFFMATWKIRTIKNESGENTRSRTESRVDIIKLHNSQTNTSDVIKKLNEMMQNENENKKYKIYGITQDVKTKQYMIVLDYYYNKRDKKYGKCKQCKRPNTNPVWCQSCDPSNEVELTQNKIQNNEIMNNCIKEFQLFQLKATAYEKVIEWIPIEKLSKITKIGEGGFGEVYSAIWFDGKRTIEKINGCYKRSRGIPYIVALKTFPGSKADASSFLKEFKNHMNCRLEGTKLEVYGLTQNIEAKNKDYLMVFQYANRGDLRKFLKEYFSELTWQKKLEQLKYISNDLHLIHKAGFKHCDFRIGNILLNQGLKGKLNSYIADLGFSRKNDENSSEGEIYGVMPYVAPEILSGEQPFTQAADIYGLGVIMAEMSTGQRPFDGQKFDTKLAFKICKRGLRPECATGTPDCYVKLAKKCMHSDPHKRPSAYKVKNKIDKWIRSMKDSNNTDSDSDSDEKDYNADKITASDEKDYSADKITDSNEEDYSADKITDSDEEDNNADEIKKRFLDADKVIKTLSINSPSHPDHMYTSKIINTKLISSAIKKEFQADSAQIDLDITKC